MKIMRTCLLSLTPALLAACAAATYNLSEKGLKYRGTLNETQAFQEVQRNTSRSREQAGVCGAHTNDQFQRATPLAVQAPHLVFDSFIKVMTGVSTSSSGVGMTTTIGNAYRPAQFKMDLKRLDKIRVFNDVKGLCIAPATSGYVVMIDTKGVADSAKAEANAVMINVSRDNLDNLVAALSFLSPSARLIEGAGL